MKYFSVILIFSFFSVRSNAQVSSWQRIPAPLGKPSAAVSKKVVQGDKPDDNWGDYMKHQTMRWDSLSTSYYTGILLGNGLLGSNIYKENDHAIRFDIGRSDVTDQREHSGNAIYEPLLSKTRLPIGRMLLKTSGKITGAKMELDIYNATARGIIYTSSGTIQFTAFIPANINVICIQTKGTRQEQEASWQFIAEKSTNTDNPPSEFKKLGNYNSQQQLLSNKGGYATVWNIQKNLNERTMLVAVGYDPDGRQDELKEASNAIRTFTSAKMPAVLGAHYKWWHDYFQQSFVSVPDRRMESFHWIQLYKLAAATRSDKPVIDVMGPWFSTEAGFPGMRWNGSVQRTYAPVFAANHLELVKPLFNTLNKNRLNLIANVPAKWQQDAAAISGVSGPDLLAAIPEIPDGKASFEPGNLSRIMFYYYQYYAYTRDHQELKNLIYPLLKRSVNYLLYQLKKDEKGIYHLPLSFSPQHQDAEDANYALPSLRWGLQTLIDIDNKENLKDADRGKWEAVLEGMAPYPLDDVAAHMLMVYPYHLINWDQLENRLLMEQALAQWLALKGDSQGTTLTGAASAYAAMGKGNEAYASLNQLFDRFIKPNTLAETAAGPAMDMPLSAETAIQELLLQSWGGKIRVFPAVPAQWTEAAFDKLRAEGAFLVSAKWEKGGTSFIKIYSLKGDTCQVQTDMKLSMVNSDKRKELAFTVFEKEGKMNMSFPTMPGETVILSSSYDLEQAKILPVRASLNPGWSWGLKKGPH